MFDQSTLIKARDELFRSLGYTPHKPQREAHDAAESGLRVTLVSGGERAGKSYSEAKQAVWNTFRFIMTRGVKREGTKWKYSGEEMLGWIVAPTYDLARPEFDYIVDDLTELGLITGKKFVSRPNKGPCTIRLPFGTIETKSSTDPQKIAAKAPDWIIVCEVAQLDWYTWLKIMARSAEKRAPIWASGTLEESNLWFPRLLTEWNDPTRTSERSFFMPSWSNLAVFPGGMGDPEILHQESILEHDYFMERFGAVPRKPSGLVFPQFDPTKHVARMRMGKKLEFHYDTIVENGVEKEILSEITLPSDYPTEIAVDPGYAGAYAVMAVKIIDGMVFVFDEIYMQYATAREVIEECHDRGQHPWWPPIGGVIDVAGRQHAGMESHEEVWAAEAGLYLRSRPVGILDGIERYRSFLSVGPDRKPRLFYRDTCTNAIREHSLYKYPTPSPERPVKELPVDAHNHCVVGDTLIDMPGGRKKIADLVGQEPYVYCCINGKPAVRKAYDIHKTMENVPIVKVIMDRGELRCTPDHLVMLADGTYVQAQHLKYGDSLMALNRYISNDGYTRIAMTGQTKRTKSEHRLVYEQVYGPISRRMHVHHKDGRPWNNHPDNLIALSLEDHTSVHHKGKVISERQRKQISERSKRSWADNYDELAEMVRESAKAAHEANRGRPVTDATRQKLSVASREMWNKPGFREMMSRKRKGYRHKAESIEKMRKAKLEYWANKRKAENHRVIAVIPDGTADVYDMNVEEAHNFIANDVVIHNSLKAISYLLVDKFGYVETDKTPRIIEVPFSDMSDNYANYIARRWLPRELR